jgi:hypothetical protein
MTAVEGSLQRLDQHTLVDCIQEVVELSMEAVFSQAS